MIDQQVAKMKILLEKYSEVFLLWSIGLIEIEGFLIEKKQIKRKRDCSFTAGLVVFKDKFSCKGSCACHYENSNSYRWLSDIGDSNNLMYYGFKENNDWTELESKLIIAKETLPKVKTEFLERNLMFLETLMDAYEKEPRN